jgi:hypothetical protein
MATISTSTSGAQLMLDLLVDHVLACDAHRRDSRPGKARVIVPTERSIVSQLKHVGEIRAALVEESPELRDHLDRIVGSLAEDLRIARDQKEWVSSFEDVETTLAAMTDPS